MSFLDAAKRMSGLLVLAMSAVIVVSCVGIVYVSIAIVALRSEYNDLLARYADLADLTAEWRNQAGEWRDMSNANYSVVCYLDELVYRIYCPQGNCSWKPNTG